MPAEKINKSRIAIFASGNGTNAAAIMEYFKDNPLAEVILLLSNNPEAKALEKAKAFHIPVRVFTRQQFKEGNDVMLWLKEANVTHVVLAGFLWLLPDYLIQAFPDHIINIHPALLPKFSGKGMYGMKVHEAVKNSTEKETGITIHLVNEHYDEGKVLFQISCPVAPEDSAAAIADKVHQLEHEHYPQVIERWIIEGSN